MTQEAERARAEVKQRCTPPSIPQGARSTFAYEEDAQGRLKRVNEEPPPRPGSLVGPGRYSPADLSYGPRVDFKSGSGRNLPVTSCRPPALQQSAPSWHDGLTNNPLPPREVPSASFASPSAQSALLATATSTHANTCDVGGSHTGTIESRRSARPGGSQSASVRSSAGYAVRESSSTPNLMEHRSHQSGRVDTARAHGETIVATHLLADEPIAQSLMSTMPHGFRHSRGRTRARGVLAPSTGVPGANGGLLGRQMAARLGADVETPGPGAYPSVKGDGPIGAKGLPQSGLPRQRPFYAAHLKALGALPQGNYPCS